MSSSRGSISRVYTPPLTVTVICMSGSLTLGSLRCFTQRAHCQLMRQMLLVLGRSTLVRARPAVLGRDLAGPRENLLAGRGAPQELLGLGSGEMLRAHGGEPDPGVGDGVAVQPDGRARGGHRQVTDPAPH